MWTELTRIVAARLGHAAGPARAWLAGTPTPGTPAEVLEAAQTLCRLARRSLPPAGGSVAEQGADALLGFIADLPAPLAQRVREVPAQVPPAAKAWLEPQSDAFVALACTVVDVWAHLLGPESADDAAILAALRWHAPRTVLDFGCGAGHFAHALAATGVQVDGIEIDPFKQAFFAYRAEAFGLRARMRLGRHRPSYDLAMALNVLDHLHDPQPALALFRACLPPGHVLCTVAAFPHDGWHQSDAEVVMRCGQALRRDFNLSGCRDGLPAWMDCWVRRGPAREAAPWAGSRPVLNPGSTFHADRADGGTLFANRFYSRPLRLDTDAATVCALLDGRHSVADIAHRVQAQIDEVLALCTTLVETGHADWDAGMPARRPAGADDAPGGPRPPVPLPHRRSLQ